MRTLLILSSLVLLVGCKTVTPPVVLTEDRAGRALTMAAIPETGSRQDAPAGVAPRHVVGEVVSKTGAKIIITKKPFHKPEAYMNTQAKAEGFVVVQPKDPWWKWPVLFLTAVGIALAIYFLDKLKSILFFWKK